MDAAYRGGHRSDLGTFEVRFSGAENRSPDGGEHEVVRKTKKSRKCSALAIWAAVDDPPRRRARGAAVVMVVELMLETVLIGYLV